MDDPIKLEYASPSKAGHSRFGIASVCMAAADYIFITLAGAFGISHFESMGNQKETQVAIVAAILGILLAVRAMQDPRHKRTLAIVGLLLNGLAIPAAGLFLPYI